MAGETGDRSLEETPTWAVAVVCAVFVIISVLIEHGIHSLGKWFQKRQKKAMSEALEKIKAELMLLGFISLLLTFGTKYIAQICIPPKVGDSMLPCKKKHKSEDEETGNEGHKRRLMSLAEDVIWRRALAADSGDDHCTKHGKVPLISQTGVHQLHIFIFVLTIFHVLYSVITMVLGQAKMNKWKKWESETTSFEYQFTNDPDRFRFASQTSFVKRHTGWSTTPGIRWIVAFFRQFFGSTTKVDYLTMRHGFINAHLTPNSKFDFHKYIKRSMEDDFKVVVGISNSLWCFAVIFLLLNVYNWYTLSLLAFLPLVILLMLGMKLEIVIMEMAQQIQERTTVVKGVPVVEPNNNLFWFSQPRWILFLIHFTLFQNAFQMAYFLWIWYEFGLTSCFHEDLTALLIRVALGLALQILCSYITFPLYALVTQMGSHMKHAIFEEQTAKALMKWRKASKDKKKLRKAGVMDASISGENTPSIGSSPIHLLHKHKSHQIDIDIFANSPRSYQSETDDPSDAEPPTPMSPDDHEPTRHQVVSHDGHEPQRHTYSGKDGETHSEDFSFLILERK